MIVDGDKVRSVVTPDDYASESYALLAAKTSLKHFSLKSSTSRLRTGMPESTQI